MMGTVAFYMRITVENADTGESQSIANQRELLYNFTRSHREFDGCQILEFSDDGYSGMNFERPGIKKLLSLAGKTVGCIIVKDFSRFGRNLVEVGDYLDQIFLFLGVRFVAVNEGYDSGRGYGSTVSLDVSLKALVYEMYSRDISEKTRSVKRAKMRNGEYLGSIGFYGYTRSETEKNHLEVDPDAAEVVRRIFRMAAGGMTFAKIAAQLNQECILSPLMYRRANHTDGLREWNTVEDITYWTKENVKNIIHDERYTGCLIGNKQRVADLSTRRREAVPREEWIITENTHEALVTKELFTQAQRMPRRAAQNRHRPYQKFRGLLKCAYCGRTLRRKDRKKAYFICRKAETVAGCACAQIRLEEADLEEAVLVAVQTQIGLFLDSAPEAEEDVEGHFQMELKGCKSAMDRYKMLLTALFEDYAEERIDKQEYLLKKQGIEKKREAAKNRFEELTDQLAQLQREPKKSSADFEKYAFVEELTREMLMDLIKEIRVSGKDTLDIKWNFKDTCNWNDEKK